MKKRTLLLFVIATFLFSCASQQELFKQASDTNTIESYEQFLSKYSEGEYSAQAREKLQELEFNRLKTNQAAEDYHNFLVKFPDGKYSDTVRIALEQKAWEAVFQDSTLEACSNYHLYCPNGKRKTEVSAIEEKLEAIYYNRAIKSKSGDEINRYLESFPNGKYVSELNQMLEEVLFREAEGTNTVAAFDNYLEKYPDGKFTTLAQISFLKAKDSYEISFKKRKARQAQAYQLLVGVFNEKFQSDNLEELTNFQSEYSKFLDWSLKRRLKNKIDRLFEESKELEYRKVQQENTIEAYEIYKKTFSRKLSWSEKRKIDDKIKQLYEEQANEEFEEVSKQNTVEGYEALKEKYSTRISYKLRQEVNAKLEELYYSQAVTTDDSAAYAKLATNFSGGKYAKEAREKLTYFELRSLINPIIHSKSDKQKLDLFKEFHATTFPDTTFDYDKMRKFIIALKVGLNANKNKLPRAIGNSGFFYYLGDFKYIPLEEGESGYKKLVGNRMNLFRSLAEMLTIYAEKKYQFETVFLSNNIAKVAALNAALKGHTYWDSLTYKDIQRAQFIKLMNNMSSFVKSNASVQSFKYSSAVQVADLEASRKLYGGVVRTMLNMLQANDLNFKSKRYILRNLPNWARLVAFGKDDLAKLKQISRNDKNAENRRLAAKALKISSETK